MTIAAAIFGVLLLVGILALLIKLNSGAGKTHESDARFRKVGPGDARPDEKSRAAGIN